MNAPVMLGLPTMPPPAPRGVGNLRGDEKFPAAARRALADTQLRRNLGKATTTTWSPVGGLPSQPLVMSNRRRPITIEPIESHTGRT